MPERRPRVLTALAALAVAAVVAGVLPAGAAAQALTYETVTLRTVPATPGVRLQVDGSVVTTDARGTATLTLQRTAPSGATGRLAFVPPRVLPTRLPSGVVARFAGFFDGGRTIGLSLYTRARLHYVRRQGGAIPAREVGPVSLTSSTGLEVRFRGEVTPELQASRVVRGRTGLRARPIEYAVDSIEVAGGNVVHRAQWRFRPLERRELTIPLLLYSLRFTSADALFGNPIGSAVLLRRPDGRTQRIPLRNGVATAHGLPRGAYRVRVQASGYSFERPVALSRDQVVDLQVISLLDLAVVFSAVGIVALSLLIVGRPRLRRELRRLVPARRVRTPR